MIYLVAIFCSPLALVLIGRPIQGVVNLVLYVLSFVFWITIIFHSVGLALWAVALLHALLAIGDKKADRRARKLAAAMARGRPDS